MAGSSKKRKKFKVDTIGGPNSDINVTPMVDVVLVLLIIFMVVTPLMEKDLEVRVPQTEEVETTVDVPQNQTVVGLTERGEITINDQPVSEAEFVNQMKTLMGKRRGPDKVAFFAADDKANYGKLVGLLDQAKIAGVEVLGMMTQLPESAAPGVPGAPPPPPPPPAP